MRGGMLKRRQLLGLGKKRNTKIIKKKILFVFVICLLLVGVYLYVPEKKKKASSSSSSSWVYNFVLKGL